MAIKPLGSRIMVKPLEDEEDKIGGIIIPDTAKEKPQEAEVVAVGPGKLLENGEIRPMSVAVGNTVIYGTYSSTEIKVAGAEYLIIQEDDVLAIIE